MHVLTFICFFLHITQNVFCLNLMSTLLCNTYLMDSFVCAGWQLHPVDEVKYTFMYLPSNSHPYPSSQQSHTTTHIPQLP